jgi:hypothetical protein
MPFGIFQNICKAQSATHDFAHMSSPSHVEEAGVSKISPIFCLEILRLRVVKLLVPGLMVRLELE